MPAGTEAGDAVDVAAVGDARDVGGEVDVGGAVDVADAVDVGDVGDVGDRSDEVDEGDALDAGLEGAERPGSRCANAVPLRPMQSATSAPAAALSPPRLLNPF
jgi:hypothetical protein